MALTEIELARARKAMHAFMQQRRPPPNIRTKLDLGFRVTGQSVLAVHCCVASHLLCLYF
jgi:hypothetical protein